MTARGRRFRVRRGGWTPVGCAGSRSWRGWRRKPVRRRRGRRPLVGQVLKEGGPAPDLTAHLLRAARPSRSPSASAIKDATGGRGRIPLFQCRTLVWTYFVVTPLRRAASSLTRRASCLWLTPHAAMSRTRSLFGRLVRRAAALILNSSTASLMLRIDAGRGHERIARLPPLRADLTFVNPLVNPVPTRPGLLSLVEERPASGRAGMLVRLAASRSRLRAARITRRAT